ncbi:MAG: hypothetical protein FWG82_01900 [Oscillospiraceae bacterium]|nr:hypothetical protein [Oscillospiraceae bacterium]
MGKIFQNKWLRVVLLLLTVTMILEIFVFNFRCFQSLPQSIKVDEYTLGSGLEPIGESGFKVKYNHNKFIEIKNINSNVKNIYLGIRNQNPRTTRQSMNISLWATDKANHNYFELTTYGGRDVVRGVERSKFLRFRAAGETGNIMLRLNENLGEEFFIDEISLNKSQPLMFSVPRVLVVFLVFLLIYIARPRSPFWKILYKKDSVSQRAITLCICTVFCILFGVQALHNPYARKLPEEHLKQYTKLADALLDGQVHLHDEPPAYLSEMENPYDTTAREQMQLATGEQYMWDLAFFEGKYYVYFGVTPAVLFFAPYKALTVRDFNQVWGVHIFCTIAVFAIFGILAQVIRKRFPKTPYLLYLLLSISFVCASGVIPIMSRPLMYEISLSSSLALILSGIYFWLSALDRQNGRLKIWALALGALCVALVAGCRPQVMLGGLLGIPILLNYLKEIRKPSPLAACVNQPLFTKANLAYFTALAVPFVVVGAGIMYYNWARFGSVLDFGANYNLTTNDMTARGFAIERIPAAVWMYFLQPPNLSSRFPFVLPTQMHTTFLIKTIHENTYGGLFNNILLLPLGLIYKYRESLQSKKLMFPMVSCLVLALLLGILSAQVAGILHRYFVDFSWLLFLGGSMMIFLLHELWNKKRRRTLYAFVLTGFFITLAFNLFANMEIWRTYWTAFDPSAYFLIQYGTQVWL